MAAHPELEHEQAYVDRAYACLEATRREATRMGSMVEVGRGGTEQARFEREVIYDTMAHRLDQLELGDAALCFGRIDTSVEGLVDTTVEGLADWSANGTAAEGSPADRGTFYIGRVAVADDQREPVVVDWRAPVAEPFYRATGPEPMGLVRRRHFATRGRTVLDIDDELFGDAAAALDDPDRPTIVGHGALMTALTTARTGRLGDIVATIQGEQDEVIRAPMPGVLVVQGGPGTGKTVVALHRAAYLLYTHRFPLEGQGVLVVGPNRLFLGYIEQVLPSLGEAGVELAVLADLLADQVLVRGYATGLTARVKGDARMVRVVSRAVRDRQRGLRRPLEVGFGLQTLRVGVEQSWAIANEARRRFRRHNPARRFVESELFAALAASSRTGADPAAVADQLRGRPEVREALEWMWPVLTPAQLLNDLFGSPALLAHACEGVLGADERDSLLAVRHADATGIAWTHDDAPLLDEARALLGARPRRRKGGDDDVRTYGHIVVDEAQDLSPMQLRMLNRRSLNGSMTVVGDIAQSTGQWAHESWDEILDLLPSRRPPRRAELTTGYRLPAPNMALAARVLRYAAPDVKPPVSIRHDGDPPVIVDAYEPGAGGGGAGEGGALEAAVVATTAAELDAVGVGNVAVICPSSLVESVSAALEAAGIAHGQATRHGLDTQVTVVPVGLVKGLELDASVVVEPARIVAEEAQGMRALYVALTRATKRLAVVHAEPLPGCLVDPVEG